MSAADQGEGPTPGVESDAGRLPLYTLRVDGEVFEAFRGRSGGTDYDWVSGPNPGYGFGTSAGPDLPEALQRESIRAFLRMIDPATGYIADH